MGDSGDAGSRDAGGRYLGGVERPYRRVLSVGDVFGLWVVLGYDTGKQEYRCRCEGCGTERTVPSHNLRRGKTRSCVRCANKRIIAETALAPRLGIPRDHCERLSNRFYALRRRCVDPLDPNFPLYGGRGIACRFESTEDFILAAMALPGWDNPALQLDRTDNEGHYERGNLRFVTSRVQNRNKRTNRTIEYKGVAWTCVDFWERFAPKYRDQGTVARKAREGLTAEEIIAGQDGCRGAYVRHPIQRTPEPFHDTD